MVPPSVMYYDSNSPNEQPVSLPSARPIFLSETVVLQPPLTRRGTGPGIILVLPHTEDLNLRSKGTPPLDPEPVQKWAEEGFVVAAITPDSPDWSFEQPRTRCIDALLGLKELDTREKFAVIVYEPKAAPSVMAAVFADPRIVALVLHGYPPSAGSISTPTLVHLPAESKPGAASSIMSSHTYPCTSPHFILPQVAEYDPGSAAVAHSRSLVFLRKWLGGPTFDLEAIWDEHTYFEFAERSVAKTMGTMVAEPYVNHVPTMTGGVGRENLTAFYRDHFIFSNPSDLEMQTISRTVGPDRVVDEFILSLTHDKAVDWLLPGVPPTGKKLTIPMLAVVNIRGDRLYNEHIWWDQATVLRQAGILPTYMPYPTPEGNRSLRLPVAGAECAAMLVDEANGTSNAMFGDDWGLQTA
ncbi:putative lea domain protein [Lyophyllum shimeji]|uniref:Lea domain protein n=1 Tax=Lyophyllum shimeji TaxID=47721 RepID=A0A9P3PCR5_LYOSH|nr:putative lea domain protein [Lyophyllum shimeji]